MKQCLTPREIEEDMLFSLHFDGPALILSHIPKLFLNRSKCIENSLEHSLQGTNTGGIQLRTVLIEPNQPK